MGKNLPGFLGALIGSIVGIVLVGSYIIHKDSKSEKGYRADAPNAPQDAEPIP
jgi:hypothetical protein